VNKAEIGYVVAYFVIVFVALLAVIAGVSVGVVILTSWGFWEVFFTLWIILLTVNILRKRQ